MACNHTNVQTTEHVTVEVTKTAILTVRETDSTSKHIGTMKQMPRTSGSMLKQLTFDRRAPYRYNKLHNT